MREISRAALFFYWYGKRKDAKMTTSSLRKRIASKSDNNLKGSSENFRFSCPAFNAAYFFRKTELLAMQ